MSKSKFSNIELLRIVAMLMIVTHHFCVHGIFNFWHTNSSLTCYLNNVLIGIAAMGGQIGVNMFVLITGYFMINSNFKLNKVVSLYLKTLLYSLLLLIIAYIYKDHHVDSYILNTSLFPFGGNAYWFITTYLMLYIFVPFLNKFILTTEESMLNSFIIVTSIFWCVIPTFTPANYGLSSLTWFVYVYFIGASIRLKTFAKFFNNKKLLKKLFVISGIVLVSYSFIRCLGKTVDLWRV